jgi:outer membrane lipoprotein LolB
MNLLISLFKILIVFCFVLSLMGCSTLRPPANQQVSWEVREAQLSQLKNFNVQGVLGIRQGKQAQKASFYLTQRDDQYQLSFYGPLGMGHILIKGDANGDNLTDYTKQILASNPGGDFLNQYLDWKVLLKHLPYWIRGLPTLNKKIPQKLEFDAYHHLQKLNYNDWQIQYERYAGVQSYDLPTKIRVNHEDFQIIAVINKWELT